MTEVTGSWVISESIVLLEDWPKCIYVHCQQHHFFDVPLSYDSARLLLEALEREDVWENSDRSLIVANVISDDGEKSISIRMRGPESQDVDVILEKEDAERFVRRLGKMTQPVDQETGKRKGWAEDISYFTLKDEIKGYKDKEAKGGLSPSEQKELAEMETVLAEKNEQILKIPDMTDEENYQAFLQEDDLDMCDFYNDEGEEREAVESLGNKYDPEERKAILREYLINSED